LEEKISAVRTLEHLDKNVIIFYAEFGINTVQPKFDMFKSTYADIPFNLKKNILKLDLRLLSVLKYWASILDRQNETRDYNKILQQGTRL
jgi:hypothetical protein